MSLYKIQHVSKIVLSSFEELLKQLFWYLVIVRWMFFNGNYIYVLDQMDKLSFGKRKLHFLYDFPLLSHKNIGSIERSL